MKEDNILKIQKNKRLISFKIILIIILLGIISFYIIERINKKIGDKYNISDYKEIEYEYENGGIYMDKSLIKSVFTPHEKDKIRGNFIKTIEELEEYLNEYTYINYNGKKEEVSINTPQGNKINPLSYFNEDFFKNHTLAIEAHDSSNGGNHYEISRISQKDNTVKIDIELYITYGSPLVPYIDLTFIVLDKNIDKVNFNVITIKERKKLDFIKHHYTDKPIIYMYPTKDTEVTVKLKNKDYITTSYPKYSDGWKVIARKDGDLIDVSTKRKLYSLYYESKNVVDFKVEKDGFIVKGNEAANFLEEKLEMLGLNERELEEFIIYWLPKLEKNKYNYIRFASLDQINTNMPLEIEPKPDNLIRVLMIFKGLEEPIEVEEQKLEKGKRTGFTVVEWGGTEIE